ncbi:unnamed protein product [Symbiodinium natans]|uniref:Uncharacterized protein n=1 Tax=Symbiodinium natans TaxID=878477 RepID=A0A812L6X5_9DINO|nr:unnamed protein product [Symbiodinium natans]
MALRWPCRHGTTTPAAFGKAPRSARPTRRAFKAVQHGAVPALTGTALLWSRGSRSRRRASRLPCKFRSEWREVAGCPVYLPASSEGSRPTCVLHFVGSSWASAAPRLVYRQFLEVISEETGAVVVATPCDATLDQDAAAVKVAELVDAALLSLQSRGVQVSCLPIWGLGHASGAVVQLLVSLTHRRAGLVLLAVAPAPNPFLASLPRPPAPRRVRSQLRKAIEDFAEQGQLRRGLRAVEAVTRGFARTLRGLRNGSEEEGSWDAKLLQALEDSPPGEVTRLLQQVLPASAEVLEGARRFRPTREDLATRLASEEARQALPKRLMVVEFGEDPQDDSSWLLSALGCEEQKPPEDMFAASGWDPLDAIDAALEEELAEAELEAWEDDEDDLAEEEDEEVREARRQLEVEWEADASSNIQAPSKMKKGAYYWTC